MENASFKLRLYGYGVSLCLYEINIISNIRCMLGRIPLKMAQNDTAHTRWSCHSGLANPVEIVSTPPVPSNGDPITVFWASRPCGPAGWLAMLLIKAGDVETNPGPTTTRKQVWICDICHRQIQVRKRISIRCNRIEHWVHLRYAGIRLAQYTNTWTCHQHIESRLNTHRHNINQPSQTLVQDAHPLPPQHHSHHKQICLRQINASFRRLYQYQ